MTAIAEHAAQADLSRRSNAGETPLPAWLGEARITGLLSRLSYDLVEQIVDGAHRATYPSGAIVPRWEEAPCTAVVLRGSLRVFIPSYHGDQVTLRYLRPGDIVGTFDAIQPNLARSMQALDESELLHINTERFSALAQREAQVSWHLLQEIARSMRIVHRSYCIRAFGSVRVRVANAILDQATAKGQARAGTVVAGTQHDLANAAGTVREVVASVLRVLKDDGVIAIRRGAVVILDPTRLAEEADGGLKLGPSSVT